MRIAFSTFVALGIGILLLPGAAEAHHGWAEFDESAEITVEATVVDFHYVNPHCVVEFNLKDDAGHVRRWQAEFSNPGVLSRKGWSAASLQPGDKLKLTGHPAKNNVPAIHVTKIRMPNGQEFKPETQE